MIHSFRTKMNNLQEDQRQSTPLIIDTVLMVNTTAKHLIDRMHSSPIRQEELTAGFKDLCRSMLKMGIDIREHLQLVNVHQVQSAHFSSRESIVSALITIQLYLPLLRDLIVVVVGTDSNKKFMPMITFVVRQITLQLDSILHSFEGAQSTEAHCSTCVIGVHESHEAGAFVNTVDEVLEVLTSSNDKVMEVDADRKRLADRVNRLVSFGTEVAQTITVTAITERIMRHCQEVLQAQRRIQLLIGQSSTTATSKKEAFVELTECIQRLEIQVNVGVLEQLVDIFVQPTSTLDDVIQAVSDEKPNEEIKELAQKFHNHLDAVCQVCGFAIAFCSDITHVRRIRAIIKVLEVLDLELLVAMTSRSRFVDRLGCDTVGLRVVHSTWSRCMKTLTSNIDSVTEPIAFMRVTLQRMREAVATIKETVSGMQFSSTAMTFGKFDAHVTRVLQMTSSASLSDHSFIAFIEISVHQLDTAHRATLKTFSALVNEPNGAESQRRFIKHCGITVACVDKILSVMKENSEHSNVVTLGHCQHTRNGFKRMSPGESSTMESTIKGIQLVSLGLTDILENLRDSTYEQHKPESDFLSRNGETDVDSPEKADNDESASTLVDTMHRLRDLDQVHCKINGLLLSKSPPKKY